MESEEEQHMTTLLCMGFSDPATIRKALRLAKNDINEAVALLTNERPGLDYGGYEPMDSGGGPSPGPGGGSRGDGGGGGDGPASSSSGASQCSPSAPTAAAAAGPYVLTTENISRMLDGWAGRKGARGGSPGMPGDAESTSTGSSDASEVSYGGAAVAPAAGGPVFENETKPAVPPSQQMPLSAIESWLFDDDNHFNTGLGRMLARRPRVPKVLDVHRRAAEVINDSFDTEAIFRGTYWTRFWSLLQKEEDCHLMKMGCKTIEIVAMEVFARHGWSFRNRLPS